MNQVSQSSEGSVKESPSVKKVGSRIHYDLYTVEEELNAIYDLINLKK